MTEFESRLQDALAFALEHRVLLVRTPEGFDLDIALGAMPFEVGTIDRSTVANLVIGAPLRTCSATDLVVHRAFAARPQAGSKSKALDRPRLWRDLGELAMLKEQPELLDTLETVARRGEAAIGPFPRPR